MYHVFKYNVQLGNILDVLFQIVLYIIEFFNVVSKTIVRLVYTIYEEINIILNLIINIRVLNGLGERVKLQLETTLEQLIPKQNNLYLLFDIEETASIGKSQFIVLVTATGVHYTLVTDENCTVASTPHV